MVPDGFHLGLTEWVLAGRKYRTKTAFTTGDGLSEFRVHGWCLLDFYATLIPAVFQGLMDLVLSRIRWEHCIVYIDDIVYWEKHSRITCRTRE